MTLGTLYLRNSGAKVYRGIAGLSVATAGGGRVGVWV